MRERIRPGVGLCNKALGSASVKLDSDMWHDLWIALALVMVIEGVIPFLSPGATKRMMMAIVEMDDKSLRISGLVSMILGVITLYLVN